MTDKRRKFRDHMLVTFVVGIAAFVPEYPWIGFGANLVWIWIDLVLES